MALSDQVSLPAPAPGLGAVVVVPARDEEALIGACVRALGAQSGIQELRWEILLVLDDCRDETAARAREVIAGLDSPPPLHELRAASGGAGGARALGMDLACERLLAAGRPGGLIATTDADSRVDPDWLAAQLEAVAAGAEAIGGHIALDLDGEPEGLDPGTLRDRAAGHAARLEALVREGPTEHPFFGGASIGITARAYRRAGGMEPLVALEDEGFARRILRSGTTIHRLEGVRVRTSARTAGRASRGLARDLALGEWSRRRTWEGSSFDVAELIAAKDRTVSLILPARHVAETIGPIVESLLPLRAAGLLDELLVVDANSDDGTAEIARRLGATVLQESELLPEFGPCLGKGDAMWRAVAAASGDVVAFCDADTVGFDPSFVVGLLGPMLTEPAVRLVKGAFERPMRAGDRVLAGEGGRVTELVARPLLNLHHFELAGLEQPLAGEIAIDRALFERLEVPVGYGVEIAMLIDVVRIAGIDAIGQVRLGTRQNRHQSLQALSSMAYEVMVAALRRSGGGPEPVPGPLILPGRSPGRAAPDCEERPPLSQVAASSPLPGPNRAARSASVPAR